MRHGLLNALGSGRRKVDKVQQQSGALQMTKELMAKPSTLGSARDEPRNVGHDKASSLIGSNQTELRVKGCEGIVRDLGPCI